MKFVYSDRYELDIGTHVFPTDKYRLVKDHLLATGQLLPEDIVEPPDSRPEDIRLVHTQQYVDDMLNLRWTPRTVKSELPLTWQIVQGYFLHASGTIEACRLGLEKGVTMHIGGGFHHAFADHGEGFCYVNDIAVGIRKMMEEGRIKKAAVVDCDLHQGNGTANIFREDPNVFTFSIHQERLYPMKEDSDLDIGLDDDAGDEVYIEKLRQAVPQILDTHEPEMVIYVAGADPYVNDQLGTLLLTKRGLAIRDRVVIEGCHKRGIPVVPVLAGGYAIDTKDTVDIHANTARECLRVLGELKPEPKPEPSTAAEEAAARDERGDRPTPGETQK
ncbi:MAG: histone deacetylase [candidate division WOR-3 bacterium]|nr:MAG: histone deacetylase [candidate division WOR-3 bacterium]